MDNEKTREKTREKKKREAFDKTLEALQGLPSEDVDRILSALWEFCATTPARQR